MTTLLDRAPVLWGLLWPALVACALIASPAWSQSQQCESGGEGSSHHPKAEPKGTITKLAAANEYRIEVAWPLARFTEDGSVCSSTTWHYPFLSDAGSRSCQIDPVSDHAIDGDNSGGSLQVDVTRIDSGNPSCDYISTGRYRASLREEDSLGINIYTICSLSANTFRNRFDACESDFVTLSLASAPRFEETISDRTWEQYAAIETVTLPVASGGEAALVYTLTPALPAGLSFDADARTIAGAPTDAQASTTYTYKATDNDGNAALLTFQLEVVTPPLTFGGESIDDQTWPIGRAIQPLTLPAAAGGLLPLTYTLRPALPDGVSFDPSTRRISGAPTVAQTATTYTYTATDSDTPADMATLTFTIAVSGELTFGGGNIEDRTYSTGLEIAPLQLPAAAGGDPPLVYTLTPPPPAGLVFDAATRRLSGAPSTPQVATAYTYTVTDGHGDTATLGFAIAVDANSRPSFGGAVIDDRTYNQGLTIATVQLPVATGGNGPLTYTLRPALPDGVSFDPLTRRISGAPTVAQTTTTYTYTATDSDTPAAVATLTFTILVSGELTFDGGNIEDRTYSTGLEIAPLQLPAAAGGDPPLVYTLTPPPPAGLVFDAATRRLSGAPSTPQVATAYTYTVTDGHGATATLGFAIAVDANSRPSFGGAVIDDRTYSQGLAIATVQLPAATGGNGPLTYTLTGALPTGLSFDAASRQIAGAPSSLQAATGYTYMATDRDGESVALNFTIAVETDSSPSFGGVGVPDQNYARGEEIEPLQLPAATGGNGALTYALTPAPPAGLALSSRRLSGAPTGAQAAATYTWRATDRDGDTAMLTFAIAVEETTEEMRRLAWDVLADIGRASLASAADTIHQRLDTPPDATMKLAGQKVELMSFASGSFQWPNRRAVSQWLNADTLLARSAFLLPLAKGGGSRSDWTFWGRGDLRRFEGGRQRASHESSLASGWLGLDAQLGDGLLAGAALSRSWSETDWRLAEDKGEIETSLNSVYGYMQKKLAAGGALHAAVGVGYGDMEHAPAGEDRTRADLDMLLALAGGRWPAARSGGLALSVTGDAGLARMETDGDGDDSPIAGLKAEVWRLRAGLEAAHDGLMLADTGSGLRLTPLLSLALRQDGGDGQTGTGLEAGARFAFAGPGSRLGLDVHGHWLALHSESSRREWGAGLQATLRPDVGGRGLSLSLGPRWGAPGGSMGALRSDDAFSGSAAPTDRASLAAGVAWGMGVAGGGLLSPFMELDLVGGEDGRRRYSAGAELGLAEQRVRARLAAEWTDDSAEGNETGIGVRLRLRF